MAGKSALRRNPADGAFGRGEQTRQHRLDRKHPRSPVLNLKLHDRLRITAPPKKQKLKLHSRIAKTKPSRPRLKTIPIPQLQISEIGIRKPGKQEGFQIKSDSWFLSR